MCLSALYEEVWLLWLSVTTAEGVTYGSVILLGYVRETGISMSNSSVISFLTAWYGYQTNLNQNFLRQTQTQTQVQQYSGRKGVFVQCRLMFSSPPAETYRL